MLFKKQGNTSEESGKYPSKRPFKILSGFFVLVWMSVIAMFSAQHGEQSGSLSGQVAHLVVSVEERLTGVNLAPDQRKARIDFWQHPVRKTAHLTVYAILGMLFYWHFTFYGYKTKRHILSAWIAVTLYAVVDETHQLFVPGRSGNIVDVAIDSTGGIVGIGFVYLIRCLIQKISMRKST